MGNRDGREEGRSINEKDMKVRKKEIDNGKGKIDKRKKWEKSKEGREEERQRKVVKMEAGFMGDTEEEKLREKVKRER